MTETKLLYSIFMPLVTAALGAWLGAHFAFKNEREQKSKEQKISDIASARRILFVLSVQFDRLLNFEIEAVKEYRDFSGRWVVMPPLRMHQNEKLHLTNNELDLLMRLDNPKLCFDVAIADAAFQSVRVNIDRRAEFFASEVQPQLGKLGILGVSANELNEIEKKLGIYLSKTAQAMTDTVCESVAGNLENHQDVLKRLHDFLKSTYPGEKFIRVEKP